MTKDYNLALAAIQDNLSTIKESLQSLSKRIDRVEYQLNKFIKHKSTTDRVHNDEQFTR